VALLDFRLQNDFESQAVIINCLLRNYLHFNLYDQVSLEIPRSNFQNVLDSETVLQSWDQCDFKNIFVEKFGENIGPFDSKQS
jgi:hypothetical protein